MSLIRSALVNLGYDELDQWLDPDSNESLDVWGFRHIAPHMGTFLFEVSIDEGSSGNTLMYMEVKSPFSIANP